MLIWKVDVSMHKGRFYINNIKYFTLTNINIIDVNAKFALE